MRRSFETERLCRGEGYTDNLLQGNRRYFGKFIQTTRDAASAQNSQVIILYTASKTRMKHASSPGTAFSRCQVTHLYLSGFLSALNSRKHANKKKIANKSLTVGPSCSGPAPRSAIKVPGCMAVVSTRAPSRRQQASPSRPPPCILWHTPLSPLLLSASAVPPGGLHLSHG